MGYGFKGTWGVGQGEFEALTLGTLAVIVLIGLAGYAASASLRREVVETRIGEPGGAALSGD